MTTPAFKIDGRKLRKALLELLADIEKQPKTLTDGGWIRGAAVGIGRVGKYYIDLEINEFDSDDITYEPIITDATSEPSDNRAHNMRGEG